MSQSERPPAGTSSRGILDGLLTSPLLWGGAVSLAFYGVLPLIPFQQQQLQLYFCGHPVAYVATFLFWSGIAALIIKRLKLAGERQALKLNLSIDLLPEGPVDSAGVVQSELNQQPPRVRNSLAGQRLESMCRFVQGRKSTDGLSGHLTYLAEFAGDQLHNSYAYVRTVTWAVPILGFLGTVIGITRAIAHLEPQSLSESFGEVTSGLGVAFATTALALALSLILVFGSYVVEKLERGLLADLEMLAVDWLIRYFPDVATEGNSLPEAEALVARQLLLETESMIRRQTESWEQSLASLRTTWTQTLDQQQHDLGETLRMGLSETLTEHRHELSSARGVLVEELNRAGTGLNDVLVTSQARHEERSSELSRQATELLGAIRSELDESRNDYCQQLQSLNTSLDVVTRSWKKIAEDQQQLVAVEKQLAENLQVAQAAESLNETVHSLNAAVHLLTARVRPNAA